MRIAAFDPGPHVGLATHDGIEEMLGAAFATYELTPEQLFSVAEAWVVWAEIVVCENFIITGSRAKSSNETIEQIGILRYLCNRHRTHFVLQQPAESKQFDPRWEKQKRLGVYRPGTDHPRSALRHLMLYMAKSDPSFRQHLLSSVKEES